APMTPEPIRPVPSGDAELIAAAAESFPEVVEFAEEVSGRRDALELARLRWLPDISPTFEITGTISWAIGAMVTLPTTVTQIRANIRGAEADLRAAEAMLREKR